MITQADLESWFTPNLVKRVFSDDGSGQPGVRLQTALSIASDEAKGHMMLAWPDPLSVEKLVDEDQSIRHAVGKLAMAVGMESKPEWYQPGGGVGQAWRKEAVDVLKAVAQANRRSVGEQKAGTNKVYEQRVTAPTPNFIFAPSGGKAAGGGF